MSLLVWYPLQGNTTNYGTLGAALNPKTSGVSYVPGRFGKCLSRGSLSWTAEQTAKAFHKTTSISFWIKPIEASSHYCIIGNSDMTNNGRRKYSFWQYENWTTLHWSWQPDDSGSAFFGGTTPLNGGEWNHVVGIQDEAGGYCAIYVNGQLRSRKEYDIASKNITYAWPTTIIQDVAANNISDFRVYNHALSVNEIKELSRGLALHYTCNGLTPDYLQFTNGQYINTGVVGPACWEFDIQWTVTGYRQLMGYAGSGDEYWGVQASGNYGLFDKDSSVQAGGRDIVVFDTVDHILTVNGQTVRTVGTTNHSSRTFYIGDLVTHAGQFPCTFKLFRCRCIQSGETIRDFIPFRQSGVWGLYDTINKQFYQKAGGPGTFTGLAQSNMANLWLLNNAGPGFYAESYNVMRDVDTVHGISSLRFKGLGTGTPSYLTIPNNMDIDTNYVTFCYWCKWKSLQNWSRIFDFSVSSDGKDTTLLMANGGTTSALYFAGRTAANGNATGGSLPDTVVGYISTDVWFFVAAVIKNYTLTTYIYGEGSDVPQTATVSINELGDSVTFINNYIGKSNWSADSYFDGNIADFRVYTSALSETDINNIRISSGILDRHGASTTNYVIEDPELTNETQRRKSGVLTAPYIGEVVQLEDGSYWLQIQHHNNYNNTNLFSSTSDYDQFVFRNRDCWAAFYLIDHAIYGEYGMEFMAIDRPVNQAERTVRHRWGQRIRPELATYDEIKRGSIHFYPLENIPDVNGGMYRGNGNTYFRIANATSTDWFGAFGCWNNWGTGDGVPTFGNTGTRTILDLYVRVSPQTAQIYREMRKGVIMSAQLKEF